MKPSPWTFVFAAWLMATMATLGALFLSEVMGHAPCVMCWYQRIFMFPLVLILPAGLFPFDPRLVRYALPLAFVGLWVAAFHALVQAGYIPESLTPCRQGIPCGVVQVEWFGFVTIPLLSFLGFLVVNGLLIAAYLKSKK
jgi:disulfide bond formation protein DsbB